MFGPTVRVFFGSGSITNAFTLDNASKGLLDGTGYRLGGDVGTDITDHAYQVTIDRGRERQLDEMQTGTCTVSLRNYDRLFDPLNASGTQYGNLTPGKLMEIEVAGHIIFRGKIEDWSLDWTVDGDANASFSAVDALGELGRIAFDAWTATAGQKAGARLNAALNRGEVNFGSNRTFDTGVATLQADVIDQDTNVLEYVQLVTQTEGGRFFADRQNALLFHDRQHKVAALATIPVYWATFRTNPDTSGVEFPFHAVQFAVGSELLYTCSNVTRDGGITQSVTDATAQSAYGVRCLPVSGLLFDSDTQSYNLAEANVYRYKTPEKRVMSITVNLSALTVIQVANACTTEIGRTVRFVWTPPGGGSAIDQSLIVEGVHHDISVDGSHLLQFDVAPYDFGQWLILDNASYGLLDSAHLGF